MMERLTEDDWELLIDRIRIGRCTPFLGAGACFDVLPLGSDIARDWAQRYDFPLDNYLDLPSVAQFLALQRDPMFPKDKIVGMFEDLFSRGVAPDYSDPTEPHRALADLPLSVYITTNYDDFMYRALKRRSRQPHREVCRWNYLTKQKPSIFDSGYKPNVANPVVYHLHGSTHLYINNEKVLLPESLVLTEDDYFDFLVNMTSDPDLIPQVIQKALSAATLLFVGYRLADVNFRVLLRSISRFVEHGQQRTHFAVMPPPARPARDEKRDEGEGVRAVKEEEQLEKVKNHLTRHYRNINVKVYWGTATEFFVDLKQRWKDA